MTNRTTKELREIMADNEVFVNIIKNGYSIYASGRANLYFEARNELERRGEKVEG